VKEHKKLEVKERKKSEAKEHKKRDVKEHIKHSSRDYLDVDDEYSTKVNLSKFKIKLSLSDSVKLTGSKTKKKSVLDRIIMRNKMISNSMFDIYF
jgi:anti-sigma-K factor RskA